MKIQILSKFLSNIKFESKKKKIESTFIKIANLSQQIMKIIILI